MWLRRMRPNNSEPPRDQCISRSCIFPQSVRQNGSAGASPFRNMVASSSFLFFKKSSPHSSICWSACRHMLSRSPREAFRQSQNPSRSSARAVPEIGACDMAILTCDYWAGTHFDGNGITNLMECLTYPNDCTQSDSFIKVVAGWGEEFAIIQHCMTMIRWLQCCCARYRRTAPRPQLPAHGVDSAADGA